MPLLKAGKEFDMFIYSIKWKEAIWKLYACALLKYKERVDEIGFDILIDLGAKLYLMSKKVFDKLELPIDLVVDWQVGLANSKENKGLLHIPWCSSNSRGYQG